MGLSEAMEFEAGADLSASAFRLVQISAVGAAPSARVDLKFGDGNALPRAIFAGGAGTLVLTDGYGNEVSLAVGDGAMIGGRPEFIEAATTATGVVAFY